MNQIDYNIKICNEASEAAQKAYELSKLLTTSNEVKSALRT